MTASKGFLDEGVTRRFHDRIADALERDPVQLQPGAHRERLKALLSGLGEMSFYELLAVAPGASEDEIHKAYSELARVVHPSHAKHLGMAASQGALDLLFERVTEAYLTLNDPDRSRVYQMAIDLRLESGARPTAEQRRKEQIEQAERLFRVSRGLVTEARYHEAVQTLRQAVKLDPKAAHYALLGECLARNPNWLKGAIEAYQAGAELAPNDPDLKTELGLLLERAGTIPRAIEQYRAALTLNPEHLDAQTGLDRLKRSVVAAAEPESGLWAQLKTVLRRSLERLGLRFG